MVALGADPRPDLIPGFSPAACNMYDADDVERLHGQLAEIRQGRVVIDEDRGPPLASTPQPSWIGWGAAGVFLLTTIALGWVHFRETAPVPAPEEVCRL